LPIEPLERRHDVSGLRSRRPVLDEWLRRHALQARAADSTVTYVLVPPDAVEVIGYHALSSGAILPEDAGERRRKGPPRQPIPVALLTRLAVDSRHEGRGHGARLLLHAFATAAELSTRIGLRALAVHPLDDEAAAFYRKLDLAPLECATPTMAVLMKDVRRLLAALTPR
jgi:GNAT superfamily N-acetyltransferase